MGDYVDRGINAVEVVSLLMLLKIRSPKHVYMLRGNHESRIMAELYNFKIECMEKYDQNIYDLIMNSFDSLPLACMINGRYFCVHGGISDKIKYVRSILKIG